MGELSKNNHLEGLRAIAVQHMTAVGLDLDCSEQFGHWEMSLTMAGGVETEWSLKSLPTPTILQFRDSQFMQVKDGMRCMVPVAWRADEEPGSSYL